MTHFADGNSGIRKAHLTKFRWAIAAVCAAVFVFSGGVFELFAVVNDETDRIQLFAVEQGQIFSQRLSGIEQALDIFGDDDFESTNNSSPDRQMRLSHTQVRTGGAFFLVNAAGSMVRYSGGSTSRTLNTSGDDWFAQAKTDAPSPGLRVSACSQDPFGEGVGNIVFRQVADRGTTVGFAGTFIPAKTWALQADDRRVRAPMRTLLVREDGSRLECRQPLATMARTARQASALPANLLNFFRHQASLEFVSNVEPGHLKLIARGNLFDALELGDVVGLAFWIIGLLVSIAAAIVAAREAAKERLQAQDSCSRLARDVHASQDADWVWETDARRCLVGVAGNAPKHLLVPHCHRIDEIAGAVSDDDHRWTEVLEAIGRQEAFSGLHVPMIIPGREQLLSIFELQGQPVADTGGFWGTARLLWEEGRQHHSARKPENVAVLL